MTTSCRTASSWTRVSAFSSAGSSERREAAPPAPLLLERLLLAQIEEQRHRPPEPAVLALQWKEPEPDRQHVAAARHRLHLARLLGRRDGAGRNVPLSARRAEDAGGRVALRLAAGVAEEAARRRVHVEDQPLARNGDHAERRVGEERERRLEDM